MSDVLIIQPIHEAGHAILAGAGLRPRMASAPDMATVAAEIDDAVGAITRNAGLNAAAMDAAPQLKVLGNHGVGVDPIDLEHAGRIGLPVVFTPYGNVQSVAEHAVSLMLAVAKSTARADGAVRTGDFGFKYRTNLAELHGGILGVVGFGRIGRRTASIASAAFAMKVIVYSPSVPADDIEAAGFARAETLEALLSVADVVSIHSPARPGGRQLINRERLAMMKPTAILVNTGRGSVIDERALIDHLREKRIMGAGLDVFESESMPPDYPLFDLPNVVLSPHIAGSTEQALRRTAEQVALQVVDVIEGRKPDHLVDPHVWPRRR